MAIGSSRSRSIASTLTFSLRCSKSALHWRQIAFHRGFSVIGIPQSSFSSSSSIASACSSESLRWPPTLPARHPPQLAVSAFRCQAAVVLWRGVVNRCYRRVIEEEGRRQMPGCKSSPLLSTLRNSTASRESKPSSCRGRLRSDGRRSIEPQGLDHLLFNKLGKQGAALTRRRLLNPLEMVGRRTRPGLQALVSSSWRRAFEWRARCSASSLGLPEMLHRPASSIPRAHLALAAIKQGLQQGQTLLRRDCAQARYWACGSPHRAQQPHRSDPTRPS